MQPIDGIGAPLDAAGRWTPGIGDPSFMGWVTVAVYLLAAALCARAARRADPLGEGWKLWAFLAVVLLLLGVNKQLDLQSLFTQIGRDMALSQGWYAHRRWVQGGFIAALALGALSIGWWLRHALKEPAQRLAGIGLSFLMAFVVMRAASFHHMDALINTRLAGIRMNWVLELAGLVVILLATRRAARRPASPSGDASAPGKPAGKAAGIRNDRPAGMPHPSGAGSSDPPLIAWLRVQLAPIRAPIERHLRRRAAQAQQQARAAARNPPAAQGASPSPEARASATATATAASPSRPAARGEVTRVRRRS